MSVCNCCHDRESEPGTGPGAVSPAEPLEGEVEELRRKPLPRVRDVEHKRAWSPDCFEPDGARAIAECVLDEVRERLLESPPVDERDEIGGGRYLDRSVCIGRAAAKTGCDRVQQVGDRNACAAQRQLPRIDPRKEQEIVCQLRKPIGLLARRAQRSRERGRRLGVVES